MQAVTEHEAQQELSTLVLDQAGRLFEEHATRAVLDAADEGNYPTGLWRAVEDAGLALALVAEEAGGAGLRPADAMRLVRLSAYHAAPIPLAETMVGAWLWSAAGGEVPKGEIVLAPVRPGDALRIADERLSGEVGRVPWARQAPHCLICVTGAAEPSLVLVETAWTTVGAHRRNLSLEPRTDLSFDSVVTGPVRPFPLGGRLGAEPLLALGALLRAQMVGAMQRCLDHSIGYAVERVQFGRPIAKFQAVQHMLAVAAGHLASATAVADEAADALTGGDLEFAAAVAKARAGEAAGEVAAICHQVHGAMGFTKEHPLHFATRRLWAWRDECGSEPYWQERIGRRICAAGGEALWPTLAGA